MSDLLAALDVEESELPAAGSGPAMDDDMSDDDGMLPACASAEPEAPKEQPVMLRIAACKAEIAKLEEVKKAKMGAEDYLGAQQAKEQIKQQEQVLADMRQRLNEVATPLPKALRAAGGPACAPAAAPRVSLAFGHRGPQPGRPDALSIENAAQRAAAAVEAEAGETSACASADQGEQEDPEDAVVADWTASSNPGRVRLVEELSGEQQPFEVPQELHERLFTYQRRGVAWLGRVWRAAQGCVLADEMGLGKTVQVCAFLGGARKAGATHALILVPVTLLDHWACEAKVWCPGWPVYTYAGTALQREEALRGLSLPEGGLLLTSYQMLSTSELLFEVAVGQRSTTGRPTKKRRLVGKRGAVEECQAWDKSGEAEVPPGGLPAPGPKEWDVVICDEAHRMKNISTLLGKSLRRLRSRCRVLLTGTPVQNALQDLWGLMDFAQPGLLGNHATFVRRFSDPIDRGSLRGATAYARALKKHLADQLRDLVAPHMLRRTKVSSGLLAAEPERGAPEGGKPEPEAAAMMEDFAAVMGLENKTLPRKRETIVWLKPSDEQIAAYKKVLEASEVIREAASKTKLSLEVFRAIGLLKRLCNHPLLALPLSKPGAWKELMSEATSASWSKRPGDEGVEAGEEVAKLPEAAGAAIADDARAGRSAEAMLRRLGRSTEELLAQSGKLRCMALLLPALAAKGHRTLVFSQSLKMLDLVQICVLRPHGLRCLRMDGQTDPRLRAEKVRKFQEQRDRFQCMLLTTGVGGVGLNLTGADRVVLVDPAWNPATDAQAVDRAYRIGQDREVRVYRLVMSGLIEDKMLRLQLFKMILTQTALEASQQASLFTAREIRALFEWTEPAEGETRHLLREQEGEDRDADAWATANEDGATSDNWLGEWIAVGISNFGLTQGSGHSAAAEDQPDALQAEMAVAKERFALADERTQRLADARQTAEAQHRTAGESIAEAREAAVSFSSAARRADDELRESKAELCQARKAEAAVRQRLQRTDRVLAAAQEQHARMALAQKDVDVAAAAAERAAAQARATARAAEERLSKAFAEAGSILGSVDQDGQAVAGTCPLLNGVRADPVATKLALLASERARAALDATAIHKAELEAMEEDLAEMERGPAEEEQAQQTQLLEAALVSAEQRAVETQEVTSKDVKAFVDAGAALAESFRRPTERLSKTDAGWNRADGQTKMAKDTSTRDYAKGVFKQLGQAWQAMGRDEAARSRAAGAARRAGQKASAAARARREAEDHLRKVEREHSDGLAEEEAARAEVGRLEEQLKEVESARSRFLAEAQSSQQRRKQLRSEIVALKGALGPARAAEKEAAAALQAELAACSKVEKAQKRVEEAKASAVERLKTEAYDAMQVEQAYQLKRKAKDDLE